MVAWCMSTTSVIAYFLPRVESGSRWGAMDAESGMGPIRDCKGKLPDGPTILSDQRTRIIALDDWSVGFSSLPLCPLRSRTVPSILNSWVEFNTDGTAGDMI